MTTASLVGALRRRLLKRGLTLKPTCPACSSETAPRDFDLRSGLCRFCEYERAMEYESRPQDTMVDTGPFLPEDDHA